MAERLHFLIQWGSISEIRAYILQHPDEIDHPDFQGRTPLWLAAEIGESEKVELLVQMGSSALDQSCDDMIPLHAAAEGGYFSTVKTILGLGSRHLNTPNSNGDRMFHSAILNSDFAMIAFLFRHFGSSGLELLDDHGNTPYHLILDNSQGFEDPVRFELFFFLVELGIPLQNSRNHRAQSVLDLAMVSCPNPKIVETIYQFDPEHFVQSDISSPLYGTILEDWAYTLLYRLGYTQLDLPDEMGNYPLNHAMSQCEWRRNLQPSFRFCGTQVRILRALGANPKLALDQRDRDPHPFPFPKEQISSLITPLSEEFILEVRFDAIFARSLTCRLLNLPSKT